MGPDVLVDLTPLDTFSRFSGTGRYVRELAMALAGLSPHERKGFTVSALTRLSGAHPVGSLEWPGSPNVRWEQSRELAWLTARRTRLPLTLRRIRPRLFHATYSLGTPRGSGIPRVVTCLDLVPLILHADYLPGRWVYRRIRLVAEALRYHSATRVLAISQASADEAMRLLKIPARKIDVVDLGVDLARYRVFTGEDACAAAAIRRTYGLDKPYVFYLGAADPRKNVDVLVSAFAKAAVDNLELVLVGRMRPSDERAFEHAMAAAGRPRGVRVLGFVPEADLPAIVGGALALVHCSTHEGSPMVHLEAMACGCPVIGTAVSSMRLIADVILVVPPRDVAATADAIRRIATDDRLRRDLSAAGARRTQRFTWRNTALGTIDSYARALASF
jgi:glycosyltransferase involved in cell wall biosynthesis